MNYKTALKVFTILMAAFWLTVPTIIYIHDPYELFHQKWFEKDLMTKNMRIQNYSLLKYGDFDSIILGSSMLQNTSAKQASLLLRSNFANLSCAGLTYYESNLMIKFAFKYKKIKRVIMSLDHAFEKSHKTNDNFPIQLYQKENLGSKFAAYTTSKGILCALFHKRCELITRNLDSPTSWIREPHIQLVLGGFNKWVENRKSNAKVNQELIKLINKTKENLRIINDYKKIVDNELIPTITAHPETTFDLLIPPYSALWWALSKEDYNLLIAPYVYLINKLSDVKNAHIYWFYDDVFDEDIKWYSDLMHYDSSINTFMIMSVLNTTHEITKQNLKMKIDDHRNKIIHVDLNEYIRKIQ